MGIDLGTNSYLVNHNGQDFLYHRPSSIKCQAFFNNFHKIFLFTPKLTILGLDYTIARTNIKPKLSRRGSVAQW